jgi:hypothetical protein
MKNHVLAALAISTLGVASSGFAAGDMAANTGTLSAVPLQRAVDEFGKVCLSAYPDKKRLAYVLGRSDFGYEASSDTREWRSKFATVADVDMPGDPSQCAFDAVLPSDQATQEKVVDAIEKTILSELSVRPTRLVYAKGMKWEWQEGARTNSVTYYFGAPIKDRQLVLTYRVGPKG